MKFEKLVLKNFSSYCGEHTIEFSSSIEKPVIMVVGNSGYGKTSIFDALNWALYGIQYENVLSGEQQKQIIDYVNETAIKNSSDIDELVEMSCTLYFEHERKYYRIQQTINVKLKNEKIGIVNRASALYETSYTGNHTKISNIESFLNELLPNNVRDYFLFNGDRINKLALPGSSKEIRDGIYRVVDLELLQNGVEHLKEIARKFRKNTKDSSKGEIAEINAEYETAYDTLENLENKKQKLNDDKRSLEETIDTINNKLGNIENIIELQKQRDIWKEKYTSQENELKQLIVELRTVAAVASIGVVLDDIMILQEVLGEKRKKGEIPSSISENLLRDLIDMGKCICGTEFMPNDKTYKELDNRLKLEIEKQKKGSGLDELFFDLKYTFSHVTNSQNNLVSLEERRISLEKQKIETHKILEEFLQKLINAPEEDISKLAANFRKSNDDLGNIKLDIQTADWQIEETKEKIQKLGAKREEYGKQQENVRKQQLRDSLAQEAADELERIFNTFAENSRLEIEKLTREEFQKFIPSAKSLKVGIDSEYHYDVKDINGNPALQQLSNGQKQALSLAYITSISRVSEKNPPLVIDMPFGDWIKMFKKILHLDCQV